MKTTDLFTSRLVRGFALATAIVLLGVGCGSSGTDTTPAQNELPTLAFQSPVVDMEGAVGMSVLVRYISDDDDDAMTSIFADRDGDLTTTGDQITIFKNQPDANGAARDATWNTAGAPEGEYQLIATIDDGVNPKRVVVCPGKIEVWNTWPHDHSNIVLKDQFGNALTVDSDLPYSPRETCGSCHDVDEIANNFHTQQGRTNQHGQIITKDDFFEDGRTWLISDGMYGKW